MRFGTKLGGTNDASGYFMFTELYDNPTISSSVANPTIRLASADHTKYMDFWHDQTNANINWNTGSLILAGGNVGIGATNPTAKLQVAGGDAYTSTAGNGLIVKSPNGAICKRIGIDNSGNIVATTVTCP